VNVTLAFDVYGTLIDPFGVTEKLQELIGERAAAFAELWRDKQIQYLFRRGLGRDYQPFSVCLSQALDYTAQQLQVQITGPDKRLLLDAYRELPAYAEAADALRALQEAGARNYAFSNGEPGDLADLLAHAALNTALDGIVSVHDVQSFKPDPAVYAHFLGATGASKEDTWLVSGNPFDIIGAHAGGWNTAWIKRNPDAVFDPWGIEPDITVAGIDGLAGAIFG